MFDEITFNNRSGEAPGAVAAAIMADPLVARGVERNWLAAAAAEADLAHDEDRADELDLRRVEIEEKIERTIATTLSGVLAQADLLRADGFEAGGEDILSTNIRAAIAALIEREDHQS